LNINLSLQEWKHYILKSKVLLKWYIISTVIKGHIKPLLC
jgi:hypothetical protein